jgi:hypothetical protein
MTMIFWAYVVKGKKRRKIEIKEIKEKKRRRINNWNFCPKVLPSASSFMLKGLTQFPYHWYSFFPY